MSASRNRKKLSGNRALQALRILTQLAHLLPREYHRNSEAAFVSVW